MSLLSFSLSATAYPPTKPSRAGTPLKRRRRDTDPKPDLFPSPPSTAERPAKRQRGRDKDTSQQRLLDTKVDHILRPPPFWDSLTQVPLVKGALRELDRRNTPLAPGPSPTSPPRPVNPDRYTLQRFARHGGPDLSDLRGYQTMPRSRGRGRGRRDPRSSSGVRKTQGRARSRAGSGNHTSTSRTKSSSPYDAAFKQHLVDGQVWPIDYVLETGEVPPPPDNLDDIRRTLVKSDPVSLEPDAFTDEAFERFRMAHRLFGTSEEAVSRTLDTIEGSVALDPSHVKRGPFKLTNLLPLVSDTLVPGNPDRAYGARPEKLDALVRYDMGLDNLILPTAAQDILCPNFIVHVKGPQGTEETANLQAVYDGSLAARGMDTLWAWSNDSGVQQPPVARTIACTYVSGVLRMYAVHRRSSRSETPTQELGQDPHLQPPESQYITTLIDSWLVRDKAADFRAGLTAFRNGLVWARKQRDEVINRANQEAEDRRRAREGPATGSNSRRPDSEESECPSSLDPIAT